MTKEEMIEQLENTILLIKQNGKDWWDERDIPVLEESIKAMQTERRWIPVSEGLPEKVGYYLTTILSNDGYHRYRDIIYFGDDKQWTRDCNVIAWMPLPDSWKEEE